MEIKNFRLNVLLRIITIMVLGYLAYYFAAFTPFWLMTFWFSLGAVVVLINLLYYIEKSYRELTNFLLSIKQNDFTSVFPEKKSNSRSLNRVFNLISGEFNRIRNEKESNFLFFKTVVEHSGVPMLAYDEHTQKVEMVNPPFQSLLSIHHITRLDSLQKRYPNLFQVIADLKPGQRQLLQITVNKEQLQISVSKRKVLMQDKAIQVVALHNINSELDQKEIESWQRLIRVMTHEIKNSVIPISTLAEVVNQIIEEGDEKEGLSSLPEEDVDDLKISLRTIEKRSKGLVKFVNAYGDLARVPEPVFEKTDLTELTGYIADLENNEAKRKGVLLERELPKIALFADVDPNMLEQVLINLVKNAIEALQTTKNGKVTISLKGDESSAILKVIDNGPGMDQETLDNIFVPFFTTKEEGSGIGLSLSRQIIKAHKGDLKVVSSPGEGAKFEILLPLVD